MVHPVHDELGTAEEVGARNGALPHDAVRVAILCVAEGVVLVAQVMAQLVGHDSAAELPSRAPPGPAVLVPGPGDSCPPTPLAAAGTDDVRKVEVGGVAALLVVAAELLN